FSLLRSRSALSGLPRNSSLVGHCIRRKSPELRCSTTSVAVYAVMIEGGLSDTAMGKMILAACFITDLGTVVALGGLFANFNVWLLVFVAVTVFVLCSCRDGRSPSSHNWALRE